MMRAIVQELPIAVAYKAVADSSIFYATVLYKQRWRKGWLFHIAVKLPSWIAALVYNLGPYLMVPVAAGTEHNIRARLIAYCV
jgi:hypothetical protein